jgi:hypothetical protein
MTRLRREMGSRNSAPEAGKGTSPENGPDRVEPVALPKWLPAVLFAAVTAILFRAFIFTDAILFGSDTFSGGYQARLFLAESLRQGVFPLWNPLLLGGTPFLDSLAGGDSLYPPALLLLRFLDPARSLGWKLVLHVFLAGLLMYSWCRALGRSRLASTVAGLGFLTAPFLVTLVYPGHDGKLFVTALAPALFWATERAVVTRRLLPLAGVGGVVALVLLTTHFQMGYFLFGAVGVYALVRSVQEGLWLRRFAPFLLASVVGAGAAGIQLIPAATYVTEYSRRTATTTAAESPEAARAYGASWSMHPEEALASLLLPEFVGNSAGGTPWTTGTYWGRNPFKLNHEYMGLILLLLAVLGFAGGARPGVRWTLAGIGAVAFAFTLGEHSPVWRILYEILPGVRLFRAPSMVIFLSGFAVATLAAFGVDRAIVIARGADEASWRRGFRFLAVGVGGVGLVALLAASGQLAALWTAIFGPPMAGKEGALQQALPHILRGALMALLLAGVLMGAVWALRRSLLAPVVFGSVVALLVVLDGGRISAPFIQTTDRRELTVADPNVRFLTAQRARWGDEPFRVLSLAGRGQDVDPSAFGIELAGGHHPNDLARYRELIGMEGSGFPTHLWDPATGAFNANAIQLVNAAFLVWPDAELGELQGTEPVSRFGFPDGRPYASVYALPTLPRAHLVAEAVVVPDAEAVETLLSDRFDPRTQVVLVEPPPVALAGGEPEGEVEWVERGPNALQLRVTSDRTALLVLSDNWFPGWKARVDGEEVRILRANHTFRAVPVPAGTSEVRFAFESTLLNRSLILSIFCTLLLLIPVGVEMRTRMGARAARRAGA